MYDSFQRSAIRSSKKSRKKRTKKMKRVKRSAKKSAFKKRRVRKGTNKSTKKRSAGGWIAHVKKYAKENNVSYKDALKLAAPSYHK